MGWRWRQLNRGAWAPESPGPTSPGILSALTTPWSHLVSFPSPSHPYCFTWHLSWISNRCESPGRFTWSSQQAGSHSMSACINPACAASFSLMSPCFSSCEWLLKGSPGREDSGSPFTSRSPLRHMHENLGVGLLLCHEEKLNLLTRHQAQAAELKRVAV